MTGENISVEIYSNEPPILTAYCRAKYFNSAGVIEYSLPSNTVTMTRILGPNWSVTGSILIIEEPIDPTVIPEVPFYIRQYNSQGQLVSLAVQNVQQGVTYEWRSGVNIIGNIWGPVFTPPANGIYAISCRARNGNLVSEWTPMDKMVFNGI